MLNRLTAMSIVGQTECGQVDDCVIVVEAKLRDRLIPDNHLWHEVDW